MLSCEAWDKRLLPRNVFIFYESYFLLYFLFSVIIECLTCMSLDFYLSDNSPGGTSLPLLSSLFSLLPSPFSLPPLASGHGYRNHSTPSILFSTHPHHDDAFVCVCVMWRKENRVCGVKEKPKKAGHAPWGRVIFAKEERACSVRVHELWRLGRDSRESTNVYIMPHHGCPRLSTAALPLGIAKRWGTFDRVLPWERLCYWLEGVLRGYFSG